MKLVKPSYEILEQEPGLQGIYKQIELAGRTCYKSLDKITEDSAEDFVNRMIASKHYAMLEHGTVYLKVPMYYANCLDSPCEGLEIVLHSPYSKVKYKSAPELEGFIDWTGKEISNECYYITTNYRVIVENNLEHLLEFLCESTEFHEKRVTVKFTSNIHFYKDITRHRKMSYAIESTRYCNYSKDKFENQLTFITPVWSDIPEWDDIEREKIYNSLPQNNATEGFETWYYYTFDGLCDQVNFYERVFLQGLKDVENTYLSLVKEDDRLPGNWKAQQAAEILPQATKADIVMTGFVSDWDYIFQLRTSTIAATGKPHPEVSRLMDPLMNEFKTRNLI